MKGIALLLLCAAAAAQASSSCTLDSVGVLLPHPKCDHYYMCFFGSQVELHCADGLLFNPKLQVCDWPHNVDCGDRIIPSRKFVSEKKIERDVRSPAEICAAEDSEGLIFDHEYCDKYYKCDHGKPVTMPCPPNLLWWAPFCYWAEQVDCGDRIRPDGFSSGNQEAEKVPEQVSGGNSDPSQAPAICAAEGSDGVLVAHENCNQFYKCYRGEPAALDCPQNLLYNPEREYCDWEWNVDCSNRIKPDDISGGNPNEDKDPDQVSGGNSDPSQAPAICAAEGSDGVLIAHENCNQFYKCFGGEPAALDCPQNLLYNPEREYCDWEWNVDCSNRIKPDDISGGKPNEDKGPEQVSGGNSDPSQAPAICAAEGSDGVLVAHENCNQFYKCYRGEPAALDCPQNLLYNPEREYCDWEWNVDCSNRIKPDDISGGNPNEDKDPDQVSGGNSDPSQAPAICAAEGSDGVLVAHENCNQFYKCYRGEPAALDCPQNLLYNPEREYCDWEWNVDCSNRIKPDDISGGKPNEDKDPDQVSGGNSDPSQAPAICAAEGSDGVLVAHENCNQFYKCFGGEPAALDCPQNLLYNPEKEYCDWDWNVNCGNRVIPSEKIVA